MKKNIILILFICAVNIVFPKEIIVKIIDNDLEIPLEGVKIQVKNNNIFQYTDAKGVAKIILADKEKNIIITASLTGYNVKKYLIKENETNITIKMAIQGVIEGKELVIEKKSIGKNDEELGVSTVLDNKEFSSTAKMGMIEDVVSTIKMLPGVSYGGNYNARLSVRGGAPNELAYLYNGFMIRYPYHWGIAYSYFNPNLIESVKFSTGIFNVKNGYAISGLVEMNGIYPNKGFKFDTQLATNTFDLLLQIPIGKTSGVLLGTRLIYTDLATMLSDYIKEKVPSLRDGTSFPIAPYIRDAYLKWYWKPNNRFEWFIDGFFASDGINFYNNSEYSTYTTEKDVFRIIDFLYYNYDAVGFTGFKILPHDRVFISFLAGYEFYYNGVEGTWIDFGEAKYSKKFREDYGLISRSYSINDLKSKFSRDSTIHSIQTRLDFDFTLHEKVILSTGVGLTYDITYNTNHGDMYGIVYDSGIPEFRKIKFDTVKENKQALKSFLYLNLNFNIIPDTLKIELGCRADHIVYYILGLNETFNNNTYHLTTYPVPGPRLNITYTPIKNLIWLDKFTISGGIGLFSKTPVQEIALSKDYGLKDFQFNLPKALSTVLGVEFEFPLGFKFKVEGYYKYYFNYFYVNANNGDDGTEYFVHSDGIGHATGFDLILQRKLSRYIDGWITYSFMYARYYNPYSDGVEEENDPSNPRGQWYYPNYHRFHTLSFVLNIKPTQWFTISPSFTFATGTPKVDYNDPVSYPAYLPDGTIAEIHSMSSYYSDVLRTNVSFPLNVKFTFNTYLGKSKIKFEAYIALEDILSFITNYILEKDNVEVNPYTGKKELSASGSYSMPFPIPSAGIRFAF
jgi:hypothetical protein